MTVKFQYQPRSFHLQWHITEKCNLACKHCYFDEKFLKKELSLNQLSKVLEQYFNLLKKWKLPKKASRISITGGEPMVRKDFFVFLKKCYQNKEKTRYGVLTNGILLNDKKVIELKELEVDYVQISLEGMEKENDEIRGIGTFKKIVKAAKILVKNGIYTAVSMTVTKQNLRDIPLLIELLKELKVNALGLRRFIPIGRGKQMKKLMLSPRETRDLYLYILKTRQGLKNLKSKLTLTIGCEDGILAQEGYRANTCVAGQSSLTILPNGDVYPCRRLPIYVGNVPKQSLEEIFYKSAKLKELRNHFNIDIRCQNCHYFSKCMGGAKCVSYGYWQGPDVSDPQFLPDPQCWRLFSKLE